MTLSIKKKNGTKTKTRKHILKSRKNILRGGGGQKGAPPPVPKAAPRPVTTAAPPVPKAAPPPVSASQSVPEVAPNRGLRTVFGVPLTVPKSVSKLGANITKTVTNAGQKVVNVTKTAATEGGKQILRSFFAKEIAAQKAANKRAAQKSIEAVLKNPSGQPPILMSFGDHEH